jgi:membrane protease YdiL (CAAX protease family)
MIKHQNIHPIFLVILSFFTMNFAFSSVFFFYEQLGFETSHVLQHKELAIRSPWFLGIFMVAFSPWIETLIFQHAIKRLLNRFKVHRCSTYILTSAIPFGMAHGLNLAFLPAFAAGLVLATVYQILDSRQERPFLYTWMLHSIQNSFAFFSWISD